MLPTLDLEKKLLSDKEAYEHALNVERAYI